MCAGCSGGGTKGPADLVRGIRLWGYFAGSVALAIVIGVATARAAPGTLGPAGGGAAIAAQPGVEALVARTLVPAGEAARAARHRLGRLKDRLVSGALAAAGRPAVEVTGTLQDLQLGARDGAASEGDLARTDDPSPAADAGAASTSADLASAATPPPVELAKELPPVPQQYQTMNNCGPATVAMALAYFGQAVSQEAARRALRPGDFDDKNVFPEELVAYLADFGLATRIRVAGNLGTLKALLRNDVPVIVHQLLNAKEDIGHYRLVRGYDDVAGVVITQDSYYGPGNRLPYPAFDALWQPYNRRYVVIFRPALAPLVDVILGEQGDEAANWARAQAEAEGEINANPRNAHAWMNLGESLLAQGDAATGAQAYERAIAIGLPQRTLWYTLGPIQAYNRAGDPGRALALADRLLAGNPTFAEAHYERGLALLALGNEGAAADAFRTALRFAPNPRYNPVPALTQQRLAALARAPGASTLNRRSGS